MEPRTSMEGNALKCTCAVEHTGDTGQVSRRQLLRSAWLDLGRNEVDDVVLKLSHPEGKLGPFTIREHVVHKRFLKDGKATIRLLTQRVQFLVSNCPPEQLGVFLRSMAIKVAARGKLQGAKRRMIGDVSTQFDEISPLNERDIEMARKNCGRADKENLTTPRRTGAGVANKPAKRKLSDRTALMDRAQNDDGPNPPKKPALLKPVGPALAAEQKKVLDLVRNGENVFFTGSAGTGKSFLLKRIISAMPPETTFPTASTGAAACHIGGTTLHAFSGIGIGSGTLEQCIAMASREHKATQWRKCKCLIIDEISMIDAGLFDKLEAVARAVRKCKKPFGGIQLVLCGDFFQLPPVTKEGEVKQYCFQVGWFRSDRGGHFRSVCLLTSSSLLSQARMWHHCITRSMELTEIYRQSNKQFIAVLQNIRIGRYMDLAHLMHSCAKLIPPPPPPTHTHTFTGALPL